MDGDTQVRLLSLPLARQRAEALAAALGEAGWPLVEAVSAFAVPDGGGLWQVEVFCGVPVEDGGCADAVRARVEELAALLGEAVAFRHRPLPAVDWVAHVQRGLAPVRAGRFFVHGAHDAARRRPWQVNLLIEAGQAFGTGHHGTTRGCLLALEWLLGRGIVRASGRRPVRVLDVGTGSGVLGIAAGRALKARVTATDIDAVAVHTARANARLNGVPGMRLAVAAGTQHVLVRRAAGGARVRRQVCCTRAGVARVRRALQASRAPQAPYSRWRVLRPRVMRLAPVAGHDLVFANILAQPLRRLAAQLTVQVRPGGWLVLSGLLREQERMVLMAYEGRGFELVRRWRLQEWSTLLLRRRVQRQRGAGACTGR